MGVVHAAEIRVLGATAIEDYYAHLMRLDRASLFPGDDRGVDAHCLDLLASGAILIGAYVKGVMRAGAESCRIAPRGAPKPRSPSSMVFRSAASNAS